MEMEITDKLVIFDIETDGLLEDVTKIHCLSYCIVDRSGKFIDKGTITDYFEMKIFLQNQKTIIGHNIVRYDIPVLNKLINLQLRKDTMIIDTLGLSWYLFQMTKDSKGRVCQRRQHGLEAWGIELKTRKVEILDWKNLTLQDYIHRCEIDVEINTTLWRRMNSYLDQIYTDNIGRNRLLNYIYFKLDCAREQEEYPIFIDVENCKIHLQEVERQRAEKLDELASNMPLVTKYKTVKRPKNMYKSDGNISKIGEKWLSLLEQFNANDDTEELKVPVSTEQGNPSSTSQLKSWLFSLGWEPTIFKESTSKVTQETKEVPQIAEDGKICSHLRSLFPKYPFLRHLEGLTILNHRKGVFESFLESVDDKGYVQAKIDGFTNSMRFQHRKPIANLPKVGKPWGKEIRGLITVPGEEYILCGSDMSALEDTTKQHYMYFFDPEYVKQMRVPGFDPHIDIAVLAKLITENEGQFYKDFKKGLIEKTEENTKKFHEIEDKRYTGKTTNFACVYGAGPPKLTKTTGLPLEQTKKLHTIYWTRNKAVKQVAASVKVKEVNGQKWLYNPVSKLWYSLRSEKDIFSVLNQGTGVYCFDSNLREIRSKGIKVSLQYHDEWAGKLLKSEQEWYQEVVPKAIESVNNLVRLNVPLGISLDFGENYSLIH